MRASTLKKRTRCWHGTHVGLKARTRNPHCSMEPDGANTGWITRQPSFVSLTIHDFDTHTRGDVAWLTVTIEGTFTADNPAALALNENQKVWQGNFVESYLPVKVDGKWKIALGHASPAPKDKT